MTAKVSISNLQDDQWLFKSAKEVVRVSEVAAVLAMSPDQVRILTVEGYFLGASISATGRGDGRSHVRIMRFSVEAWWLNRMEEEGTPMPVKENERVSWWRTRLKEHSRLLKGGV